MAEKPLARRLDDIEDKLDDFIANQDKLIQVMEKFDSTMSTLSNFEDSVKSIDTLTMKRKVSDDWIYLAEYCIANDFDAEQTMKIMRIFTGDFRKDREDADKFKT